MKHTEPDVIYLQSILFSVVMKFVDIRCIFNSK